MVIERHIPFRRKFRHYAMVFGITMLLSLISVINFAHAQCAAPMQHGLVAHWKLDETSGNAPADSSGNGNNGSLSAGSATWSAGQIGNAVSDVVFINASMAGLPAEEITTSVWVYVTTNADWNDVLQLVWNSGTGGYAFFSDVSGNLRFGLMDGGVQRITSANGVVQEGEWMHWAATYDGSDVNVYLNGEWQTSQNYPGIPLVTSGNFYFGDAAGDAAFDDIRVYNRALSAEEIESLYLLRSTEDATSGTMVYNTNSAAIEYCDGTDWVHAGVGPYNPDGVRFDGTNDWFTAGPLSGDAQDTKKVTGSFWFRPSSGDNYGLIFRVEAPGGIRVVRDTINRLTIYGHNAADTEILNYTTGSIITDDVWQHVIFSVDLSDPAKRHVYVYDLPIAGTWSTYTDDLIRLEDAGNNVLFGASTAAGVQSYPGDIADFWLDFGTYIDLSLEENRRRFIASSGAPMYLGADGSLPTGQVPDIFLSGDNVTFSSNRGSGGSFTVNGELQYSSSQPADSLFAESSSVGWISGGSNILALVAAAFQQSGACTPTIYNATWDSMSAASGSSFTISSYTVPSVTDGMLFVAIANEDDNSAGDAVPTGVTFDGTPMDEAVTVSQAGNDKTASLYYLGNPTASTGDIVVTTTGTVEAIQVGAYVFDCLLDQAPIETQTATSGGQIGLTLSFTGLSGDTVIVDSFEHGASEGSSMDVTQNGQIKIFSQDSASGATSSQGASYIINGGKPTGNVRYNNDFNVMEFYNGFEWVAMGPVGGADITSGLVAHWLFDETSGTTAVDSVGGYNMSLDNGLNADDDSVPGVDGNAFYFGGNPTDDEATVTNAALDLEEFTFSAWVLAQGYDDCGVANFNCPGIVRKVPGSPPDNASHSGWYIVQHSGGARALLHDATGTEVALNGTYINDGKWHHVVLSRDSSKTNTLYVDGIAADSEADTYTVADTDALMIGANLSNASGGDNWQGAIDDVRYYNRALTANEVKQLFYLGASQGLGDVDNGCSNAGSIVGATAEGKMFYNIDQNVMQYCNGEEWIGIGK